MCDKDNLISQYKSLIETQETVISDQRKKLADKDEVIEAMMLTISNIDNERAELQAKINKLKTFYEVE